MDTFKENCFGDNVARFFVGGGDNDGLRSSMVVHVGQVYRVLFVEGFRGPQGDWPSDNGGYVRRSKVSSEIQCCASL